MTARRAPTFENPARQIYTDLMPIILNLFLICSLVALLLNKRAKPALPTWRRIVAGLLLVMLLMPIGVWQGILYLIAKEHAFAADPARPIVAVAKEHLPLTASHLAVEVVFIALAIGVGGLLRQASRNKRTEEGASGQAQ